MDDLKRTTEYRKLLPFIAKASSDVGEGTLGEEVQALVLALNTHKTSGDHDGRYYTETEVGTLFSNHSVSGDHDGRYYTESEITSFLSLKADKAITLTAGNGLTGGGNLSADRTFNVGQGFGLTVSADAVAVDLAANFSWTGAHTFSGSLTTASIMPMLADVYDLGDYTKPWRKIWGSELSAVVFSQYEQVLLGGWLTISKGEGKLTNAVTSTDTQIDLGAGTLAENDILVFRSISSNGTPQMEYMKVGTLVSGTTYNVTRNLDGTGANNWPEGTVYGNWGKAGNGRVELNAYDTPRLSVYSHGAAIADFREQVRIGDLSNGWGYGVAYPAAYGVAQYGANTYGLDNYGAAFGAYAVGQANITIDPANGIRIRNYNQTVIQLNGTAASFENFIILGASGGLRQGTGTWGSSFTGTAIWSESSVMNMGGWNAGVKQWWGGSDGKFYAGGGNVIIDNAGIKMAPGDESTSWLSFQSPDLLYDKIRIGSDETGILRFWSRVAGVGMRFTIEQANGATPNLYWWTPTTNVPRLDISGGLWVKDYAAINVNTDPNYGLIVKSKGNTSSTAVLLLKNSDGTDLFTLNSAGNAAMGTAINTNYGLIVRGPGNTSATSAFLLENSDGTDLFSVNSIGDLWIKGNSTFVGQIISYALVTVDSLFANNNVSALSFTDRP